MASLVGGASVITFPVLLALGLPPVVATASNLVAVSAGNFLAAVTDRSKLPPFNRAFVGLVLASVLGAVARRCPAAGHARAPVRVPDSAAARFCDRAIRPCRPHHGVAARAGGRTRPRMEDRRHQHPAGAADLDLRRLFRRRRRHAAARRADDRDRRRLSPRQRGEEPGVEPQHARRLGVVHRQRRGELAADAGDDGRLPGRSVIAARTWRAAFRRRRCGW